MFWTRSPSRWMNGIMMGKIKILMSPFIWQQIPWSGIDVLGCYWCLSWTTLCKSQISRRIGRFIWCQIVETWSMLKEILSSQNSVTWYNFIRSCGMILLSFRNDYIVCRQIIRLVKQNYVGLRWCDRWFPVTGRYLSCFKLWLNVWVTSIWGYISGTVCRDACLFPCFGPSLSVQV